MTTTKEVRQAMATAITNGAGLRCAWYQLSTNAIHPSCGMIARPAFDPRMVFGGTKQTYTFRISIIVDATNEEAAQAEMEGYCDIDGQTSIVTALQDDTLYPPNLVHYVSVTQVGETGSFKFPDDDGVLHGPYLVTPFDVEVVF